MSNLSSAYQKISLDRSQQKEKKKKEKISENFLFTE